MTNLIVQDQTFYFDLEDFEFFKTKSLSIRLFRNSPALVFYENGLYYVAARIILNISGTKQKFFFIDTDFHNLKRENLSLYTKDLLEERKQTYYDKHKEVSSIRSKIWYANNKERVKELAKKRPKKYYKETRAKYRQRTDIKERYAKYYLLKRRENNYRFRRAKYKAKERGLSFTLSKEEFMVYLEQPCFYCGDSTVSSGVGLDRINNSLGYELENVLPCCASCNKTRGDRHTVEETLVMINALQKYKYLLEKERDDMTGLIKEEK